MPIHPPDKSVPISKDTIWNGIVTPFEKDHKRAALSIRIVENFNTLPTLATYFHSVVVTKRYKPMPVERKVSVKKVLETDSAFFVVATRVFQLRLSHTRKLVAKAYEYFSLVGMITPFPEIFLFLQQNTFQSLGIFFGFRKERNRHRKLLLTN